VHVGVEAVSVHTGDQFASFDAMRFSLPPAWRGRTLWARYAAPMLRLFDDQERLIRQYVVEPGKRTSALRAGEDLRGVRLPLQRVGAERRGAARLPRVTFGRSGGVERTPAEAANTGGTRGWPRWAA